MLSTFIKLPFVIKICVLSIFEWPLMTGLQRATPESHVQNKPLVYSIGCPCTHWLFRFSILHSNKNVNTITY